MRSLVLKKTATSLLCFLLIFALGVPMLAVRRAAAGHRLLGADICGGLTLDKGGTDADFELNLATDKELEKLFGNLIIDSYL